MTYLKAEGKEFDEREREYEYEYVMEIRDNFWRNGS